VPAPSPTPRGDGTRPASATAKTLADGYDGVRYEGRHEPIITKELFDRVQAVLERKCHPMKPKWQPKPLAGLFRCGGCGMSVTAEVQKGHTYYRCTRKSKKVRCTEPFVRGEELERQLGVMLAAFSLDPAWADDMIRLLEKERKDAAQSVRLFIDEKRQRVAAIAGKLQKLLEAYLEELIDREAFAEQKQKFLDETKALQEQIAALEGNRLAWLEPFRKWVLTAKTAAETASTGSLHERKALAQEIFGSNLILDTRQARGSASKPWSLLQETRLAGGMVGDEGFEPPTHSV
jgi:site-specific DNA recombinase